jgi:hypothetical protein
MTTSLALQVSDDVRATTWYAAVRDMGALVDQQSGGPTARQAGVLAFLGGWEYPILAQRMSRAAITAELGGMFATLATIQHEQALGAFQAEFQDARQQLLRWVASNWAEALGATPGPEHLPWDAVMTPVLAGLRRALTPDEAVMADAMSTPERIILGRLVDLVDDGLAQTAEHGARLVAPRGQQARTAATDLMVVLAGVAAGRALSANRIAGPIGERSDAASDQAGATANQWAALWAQAELGVLAHKTVDEQRDISRTTGALMAAGYHEGLDDVPAIWRNVQAAAMDHAVQPIHLARAWRR